MRRKLLFLLPALREARDARFRKIKYALFPPLSLLTLAALTDEGRYEMIVRDEHVESPIVDMDVDLVAMTVYASSANRAYELAAHYRARGATVMMGGIHPTAMPEEVSQHADAVCMGPGEPVWAEMLRDFEHGKLRRFYRGNPVGSAARVPTIARRDLMNPRGYLVPQTMITSRGCPHACDFCYKTRFWGKRYHECRPLADVERELASFAGPFVFFLDDNFLANRRRTREIFAVLRGSGIVWQAGASLDVVGTSGYLEEAYAAGCRSLFVGLESISRENMHRVNKPVNAAADYVEAIRRFHDAGIMVNGSFVLGLDHDGPDVFRRTLDFAVENQIETATFHTLTPFPGTRTFDEMLADGRIIDRNWDNYDTCHAVFRPRRMTPAQLEEGYHRLYRDFYRCGAIWRRSTGLPSAFKRLFYNVAWKKLDALWAVVLHTGLLPLARPVLDRVLRRSARPADRPRTVEPETRLGFSGDT